MWRRRTVQTSLSYFTALGEIFGRLGMKVHFYPKIFRLLVACPLPRTIWLSHESCQQRRSVTSLFCSSCSLQSRRPHSYCCMWKISLASLPVHLHSSYTLTVRDCAFMKDDWFLDQPWLRDSTSRLQQNSSLCSYTHLADSDSTDWWATFLRVRDLHQCVNLVCFAKLLTMKSLVDLPCSSVSVLLYSASCVVLCSTVPYCQVTEFHLACQFENLATQSLSSDEWYRSAFGNLDCGDPSWLR